MTLVDAADVPALIKGGYEPADVDAALSWASAQVEAYCERQFAYVEDDVVTVTPFRNRTALLPNPPVVSVSLVEAWLPRDGVMAWVPLANYQCGPDGLIYDTSGLPGVAVDYPSWPLLPHSLRVTYTHGFETIPQPVAEAVIRAAAGYLENPWNVSEKRVDDVALRWSVSNPASQVDDVLLAAYRLVSL